MSHKRMLLKLAQEQFQLEATFECEVCSDWISCDVPDEEGKLTVNKRDIAHALFENGVRYVDHGKIDGMEIHGAAVCEDCFSRLE